VTSVGHVGLSRVLALPIVSIEGKLLRTLLALKGFEVEISWKGTRYAADLVEKRRTQRTVTSTRVVVWSLVHKVSGLLHVTVLVCTTALPCLAGLG